MFANNWSVIVTCEFELELGAAVKAVKQVGGEPLVQTDVLPVSIVRIPLEGEREALDGGTAVVALLPLQLHRRGRHGRRQQDRLRWRNCSQQQKLKLSLGFMGRFSPCTLSVKVMWSEPRLFLEWHV